jgi:nitroreductase
MTTETKPHMSVFDTVRTVLAVREFTDQPLREECVRRIAEAAHLTASSQNGQPWHFVFVRDKEMLRKIAEADVHGPYVAQAPLAVVAAYDEKNRFGVSDVSRAIQSMILVAWSEGIGSNWTGWGGLEAVNKLLDIPDNYKVLAVVPFGYPARPLGGGRKNRKPLGEVISRERFGEPFA